MKIGATEETNHIVEYGTPGSYELITLIVDGATSKWLQNNVPSGSVIRIKGIKTDCSVRVAYDPNNDQNKPITNADVNVVTTTTGRPNPTTTKGGDNTETFRPTTTVNPPPQTTTTDNPPPQTTTGVTTTTIVNPPTPEPGRNLKIAVVLFGFSNDPAPQQSGEDFLNNLMYGNGENGMTQIFGNNFYNKVSMSGIVNASKPADVFGWINIKARNDDNCNSWDWTAEAGQIVGVNEFSGYDHVIHVASRGPLCSFGGLASVPGWWNFNFDTWTRYGTKSIIYHELGHNFGFNHAGACANLRSSKLSVTDASFGSCDWEEYGDYMDLMGVPPRDEVTEYKGWRFESNRRNQYYGSLPATNAIKVGAGNSGVYTISNADDFTSPLGTKIISVCHDLKSPRFVRGYQFEEYCLEMTNTENMKIQHPYSSGVVVRLVETSHARSAMLNVLGADGDYFEDAERGFKVTLISINGASANVRIDLV